MSHMRTFLAALTLALLTACGGDADAGPRPDPDDLAAEIGCKGDMVREPYVVSCEAQGSFVGITVYDSNEERDAAVEIAQSAGATVLVGDRFMIDSPDVAMLELARDKVGGEVK